MYRSESGLSLVRRPTLGCMGANTLDVWRPTLEVLAPNTWMYGAHTTGQSYLYLLYWVSSLYLLLVLDSNRRSTASGC